MRAYEHARNGLVVPLCLLLLGLTACSGRVERGAPFRMGASGASAAPAGSGSYVWARNDGRRMAENPTLLKQGQKDQSECRSQASQTGVLNQNAYFECMRGRGYSPRLQ